MAQEERCLTPCLRGGLGGEPGRALLSPPGPVNMHAGHLQGSLGLEASSCMVCCSLSSPHAVPVAAWGVGAASRGRDTAPPGGKR